MAIKIHHNIKYCVLQKKHEIFFLNLYKMHTFFKNNYLFNTENNI